MFHVNLNSCIKLKLPPDNYPKSVINERFLNYIKNQNIEYSTEGIDRLFRAHGHSLREIYMLKQGLFSKIPDIVVWPSKAILLNLDWFSFFYDYNIIYIILLFLFLIII